MPTRRVAKNSIFVIASVLLGGVLIFLVMILIARYLGVEEYGQFSTMLALVSIIQLFADGGIVNITIRDIAVNKDKLLEHVGTTTVGLLFVTIIMTSLVSVYLLWANYEQDYTISLVVMLLAAFSTLHGLVFSAAFRAMEHMHVTALAGIAHKVVLTALVVVAIFLDTGIVGVAVAHLMANIALLVAFIVLVSRKYGRIIFAVDVARWRSVAKDSIPLGVSMVLRKLTVHLDVLLLTFLSTAVAVGLYSSAYRILQMIEVASIAFAGVLFPYFSKLAQDNKYELSTVFNGAVCFLLFVSAPIAVWFYLSAENLVTIFYGEDFYPAYKVLELLGIALVFLIPAALIHPVFTALHRQKILMYLSLASLALNLTADLILIPLYSYFGAAIGTAVTECIIFVAGMLMLRRERVAFDSWRKLFGISGAVVIAATAYRYMPDTPGLVAEIFRFSCYLVIYLVVVVAVKIYTPADVKKILAKPNASTLAVHSEGQ